MKKMWLIIFLILALSFVYAIKQPYNNMKKSLANTNFNEDLPKIFCFHSDCPHCSEMIPILIEIQDKYSNKIEVKLFNINDNSDLVSKYSVLITPTLVFLDKEDNILDKHVGDYNYTLLENKIIELEMN